MTRAALLAVVAAAACKSPPPEISGIDKYRIGHTTRGDVDDGVCQPTDIADGTRKATWCFAMPPYQVAGRTAELELYFEGTEPSGALIELQLKIRGCDEQALDHWLRTQFGPPIESRGARAYWKNSIVWIAGFLPQEPGRCLIRMLPLSEQAEIARIKAK